MGAIAAVPLTSMLDMDISTVLSCRALSALETVEGGDEGFAATSPTYFSDALAALHALAYTPRGVCLESHPVFANTVAFMGDTL